MREGGKARRPLAPSPPYPLILLGCHRFAMRRLVFATCLQLYAPPNGQPSRMLYYLLFPLAHRFPLFNVFRYITFRTAMAAVTALLLALVLGPPMIRLLKRRQIGQSIRQEGPKSHLSKAGTPTMGGLLILLAVFVATLLWMDLSNRFVWIGLATLLALGVVGFVDDFVKFMRRRSLGLTGKGKLVP